MRHGVKKARLGRPADQRKALVRSLVTEVLRHGKIKTTKVCSAVLLLHNFMLAVTRSSILFFFLSHARNPIHTHTQNSPVPRLFVNMSIK